MSMNMTRPLTPPYRYALLVSAVLKAFLFTAEFSVGLWIGSAVLLAAAIGTLRDVGTYGLSGLAWSPRNRARANLALGAVMCGVGLVAAAHIADRLFLGGSPAAKPIAITAVIGLLINLFCGVRFNRWNVSGREMWRPARVAVVLSFVVLCSSGLVALTAAGWPDIFPAMIITAFNAWVALQVMGRADQELRNLQSNKTKSY
jgi:Co/Zn/Cd efflux system component